MRLSSPAAPTHQPDLPQRPTRRQALQLGIAGIVGAGTAPLFVSSRVLGAESPSGQITLGFIGLGTHGLGYNLQAFLEQPDARVVAVCDVYADRSERARQRVDSAYKSSGCRVFDDFRQLLAQPDIDAVVISTPDHWHTPMSLMALEAGKDVMCEKPTLTIAEGRVLADFVKRSSRIFQVGLEDRSVVQYHRLAELVRNGAIGRLETIHVKLPAGENFPKEEAVAVPDGLNWEMWLGPAPFHPYTPTRTGPQQWRNIRDYAGGKLADWGAHLIDTAQVANFSEQSGPVEVQGTGIVPRDSMSTAFVDYELRYRYANGVVLHVESGGVAIRFEGSNGWVGNSGWRGPLQASSEGLLRFVVAAGSNKLWPIPPGEHRDFLDCVKSRQTPTYPVEHGHRLSTVMHLGNIAMQLGRTLQWDPQREKFVNDASAQALCQREQRTDWMRL